MPQPLRAGRWLLPALPWPACSTATVMRVPLIRPHQTAGRKGRAVARPVRRGPRWQTIRVSEHHVTHGGLARRVRSRTISVR